MPVATAGRPPQATPARWTTCRRHDRGDGRARHRSRALRRAVARWDERIRSRAASPEAYRQPGAVRGPRRHAAACRRTVGRAYRDRACGRQLRTLAASTIERWFGRPFLDAHPDLARRFRDTAARPRSTVSLMRSRNPEPGLPGAGLDHRCAHHADRRGQRRCTAAGHGGAPAAHPGLWSYARSHRQAICPTSTSPSLRRGAARPL